MNEESLMLLATFNILYDHETDLITKLGDSIRSGRGYEPATIQEIVATSDQLEALRTQISELNQFQESEEDAPTE